MKKLLLVMIVLIACIACLSSCKLTNKVFPCKHKDTVTDAAVAATCTESGLTEGKHCAKCGETVVAQEKIPALGHTEVIDSAVTPTCTTTGLTEGKHCSVCNTVIIAQAVAPQMHNYGEWTVLIEPGCFTEGEKTRTCSTCKIKENINIETLDHNFVQDEETKLFACEHCDARIYAGHLYAAFDAEVNWYDAYKICESMGGYLATITSAKEQALITEIISSCTIPITKDYRYWAGGLQRDTGWTWITGEDFEYVNWGSKEPDGNKDQWLLALASTSKMSSGNTHFKVGEWEDLNHKEQNHGFICEWELDIVETEHFFTEWEITTEATCFGDGEQYRFCTHCGLEETETLPKLQHNFIFDEAKGVTLCEHCNAAMYGGHIYKIFDVKLSWFDAYAYCNNLGGHLVTITSEEEQTFVETYMNSQSFTACAWIGAYSDGVKWQWITDEEFDYTNWLPGEPNCQSGTEFFAQINYQSFGKWNDLPPLDTLYLICEWEA